MSRKKKKIPLPKIGDDIYIPTRMYLSSGRRDIMGGLAKVIAITKGISAGKEVSFIAVEEVPDILNWDHYLFAIQQKLKTEFGSSRARPDPDYSDLCNEP